MEKAFLSVLLLLCCIAVRAQPANAVNTCNTWTFQLQLTSAGSETPVDAIQLAGNDYIICGYDSSAAGVRGRLIKLNQQGTVLQSKTASFANRQLVICKARLSSTGKLYALATATNPLSGETTPHLLCIDTASLAVLSALQLNNTAGAANWKGVDLCEGSFGNLLLLCHNNTLINVTSINIAAGSIDWSKTYTPRNGPRPVGMGALGNDVYIAWNETDSSYSKAVFMNLDQTTGAYKSGSRTGGGPDGLNVVLQSFAMANLRARITGYQYKSNQYQAIRINYHEGVRPLIREVFSISGFTPAANMQTRQDDLGQMLALQAAGSTGPVQLIQTNSDNHKAPVRSWLLQYNYPVTLCGVIATSDGGKLAVGKSGLYPHKIVVTKTDSAANLPGCNVTDGTATLQIAQPNYTIDTLAVAAGVLQPAPAIVTVADLATSGTAECKTLFCPAPPQPDTCLRTFFKEYRNDANSTFTSGLVSIGDGRFLMQAMSRDVPYTGQVYTQLTVVDTAGHLLDSRKVSGPQPIELFTLTRLRDGNLLGTGWISNGSSPPADIYLIKFSAQFAVLWQKR